MNNLNVASFEASKKLHDAGIVLETDWYWVKLITKEEWVLSTLDNVVLKFYESIPAPSMEEVWRELPEGIKVNGSWAPLFINKIRDVASVGYRIEHHVIVHFSSENPTDALIELWIWIVKENKKRIVKKLIDMGVVEGKEKS